MNNNILDISDQLLNSICFQLVAEEKLTNEEYQDMVTHLFEPIDEDEMNKDTAKRLV